jgi:hypothetical protein
LLSLWLCRLCPLLLLLSSSIRLRWVFSLHPSFFCWIFGNPMFFFWIPDFPEGRLWQFYLIRWRKLLFFVTCLYIIVILNIIYFLYIIFLSPLSVLLSPIRFYFFVFVFMFFLVFLFLFFIFSYLYLFCFFIF